MANCNTSRGCGTSQYCVDGYGCPDPSSGICPDFRIKRHDTKPSFEVVVTDCKEPIDLTDTVVEASMWAAGRLKTAIATDTEYFALADNIGFQQAAAGDIIVVSDQARLPEQMLITGFDEDNKLIRVQRAYGGSIARSYRKGTRLRIFRMLNAVGSSEMTYTDILQVDGETEEDVLTESKLIYEWAAGDTCLPGCYYLELKLLKMTSSGSGTSISSFHLLSSDITPSFVSPSEASLGCDLGAGVEWVRRFPVEKDGYLIQIVDSPTSELLV